MFIFWMRGGISVFFGATPDRHLTRLPLSHSLISLHSMRKQKQNKNSSAYCPLTPHTLKKIRDVIRQLIFDLDLQPIKKVII